MSHFCVMVIGEDPENQLAPYQENNMDDCPEEFMEFQSVEQEYKEKYSTESTEKVVMPDGRLLDPWDDEFRVKTDSILGIGFGSDTHKVPENLEKRKIPYKNLFATFEEYMSEWCGYSERDPKTNEYGSWDNPNKKWDWYELGGRWLGYFKLKHPNMEHEVGRPGVFKNKKKFDCDQARKGQVDFEYMQNYEADKARERYEFVGKMFGGSIPKVDYFWKDIIDDSNPKFKGMPINEKRELYWNQPALKQLEELKKTIQQQPDLTEEEKSRILFLELDDYQVSKEEFIEDARANAYVPFAVVKDGKWHEKGKMLFWAFVSDEKDQKEWNNQFHTLINDLPDDTLLSLYDCHI
jgi:hypothetical protein